MPLCVCVPRRRGEEVVGLLGRLGIIDDKYRIYRSGGLVCVPVKEGYADTLNRYGLGVSECNPPERRRRGGIRVPSHDRIGDVVILRENAFEEYGPDKAIESILSAYKSVRAIYVKTGTIDEFRIPVLKLLWGVGVEEAVHREYGLSFRVRLGRVYYNPRLAEEHRRIASMVRDGEVVGDLFAGIGGFTIHIASLHESVVVANDLNPEAFRLIIWNTLLNKRRLRGRVLALNLDTRILPGFFAAEVFDRLIANLPHSSLEFMDIYGYLLRCGGLLHLYVVGRDCESIRSHLPVETWGYKGCRRVLDYAPHKYILRIDLVKAQCYEPNVQGSGGIP